MDKKEIKKAISILMKANGVILDLPLYMMEDMAENADVDALHTANVVEEIADYLDMVLASLEAQGK